MMPASVNYVSIVIASVLAMVVGFLWYSPMLFAKQWMKESGLKESDIKKEEAKKGYLIMFVASLAMAFVLAQLVYVTNANDLVSGATVGFMSWFGFVLTTQVAKVAFEGQSQKLFLINVGHYLVAMMLMGAFLAMWR